MTEPRHIPQDELPFVAVTEDTDERVAVRVGHYMGPKQTQGTSMHTHDGDNPAELGSRVVEDGGLLTCMADEVSQWAISKGWEPDPNRTFGDECALLHSEISEALEAWREWGFESIDVLIQPDNDLAKQAILKPEGVPSEFADLLIRLLHYSAIHNIDLFVEYRRKMDYNYSRSYRHGGKAL